MEKLFPEICNYAMFCGGCGHGVLVRLICECLEEYGLEKETIAAIGVGCSCHLKTAIDCDLVQCPHGRAAAVGTGIRRAEPTKFVFTYQGDGDAYNIGIAETLNTVKQILYWQNKDNTVRNNIDGSIVRYRTGPAEALIRRVLLFVPD